MDGNRWAPRGGLERERLRGLVDEGRTVAEIAVAVDRSPGTVRHWLARFGLRTEGARRRQSVVEVGRTVMRECAHHGVTEFVVESTGYARCKRCRAERVVARRRRVKQVLVAEAGGCCRICGYSRFVGALEFHHLDPATKRIGLSYKGMALALATLREEAAKCVLLCSNCHAEVEGGATALPVSSQSEASLGGESPYSGVTQSAE